MKLTSTSEFVHRIVFIVLVALSSPTLIADVTQPELSTSKTADTDEKIGHVERKLMEKISILENRLAEQEKRLRKIEKQTEIRDKTALEREAALVLRSIASSVKKADFSTARKQLATLMKEYGATQAMSRAYRYQREFLAIGKDAPKDFRVEKWFQGEHEPNLTGDHVSVLFFWEVWCPHCRREMPKIDDLYLNNKADGLNVIAITKVNKSATDEKVEEFIGNEGIQVPILKEDGSLSRGFFVSGVPAAAVVKGGKIIWRGHPMMLSEALVKSWL